MMTRFSPSMIYTHPRLAPGHESLCGETPIPTTILPAPFITGPWSSQIPYKSSDARCHLESSTSMTLRQIAKMPSTSDSCWLRPWWSKAIREAATSTTITALAMLCVLSNPQSATPQASDKVACWCEKLTSWVTLVHNQHTWSSLSRWGSRSQVSLLKYNSRTSLGVVSFCGLSTAFPLASSVKV